MNDFHFDIFSESLKELQHEKKKLENILENQKAKRKDLEAKVNLVNARFSHVNERHAKILATRDIAKQKVGESRDLGKRLQQQHSAKQIMVSKIQEQIEEANKAKDTEIIHISEQLEDLAKKFFSAQEHFNSANLNKELHEWIRRKDRSSNEASKNRKLVQQLHEQFARLDISHQDEKPTYESSWPELAELENALALFRKEQELAIKYYQNCKNEIATVKDRIQLTKENTEMIELEEQSNLDSID